MRCPRILLASFALVAALLLLADAAQARSSRRNNRNDRNSRGFTGRIIYPEDGDRRKRDDERKKKQQEETRKRAEERKQKAAEKKREQEEKKKAAEAKRKEQLEKTKKAREERLAKAKARKTAKPKGDGPAKGGADGEEREAAAAEALEQAEAAFGEKKLLEGVKLLRQAADEGAGTASGREAADWLADLCSNETVGPAIFLGEAEELFEARRYRRAMSKYNELLAKFPKGEQADEARKRLTEIDENDLLSKTEYTQEELEDARLWYLAGNIHGENRRKGDAMAAYRHAIENYPGCPYAVQAEEKLAALRR